MKINLVSEKHGKIASIKLTEHEIRDLYDWFYICDDECKRCSHLKKINKLNINALHRKFEHLVHDIIDDGRWFTYEHNKFVRVKERRYLVKKPIWH